MAEHRFRYRRVHWLIESLARGLLIGASMFAVFSVGQAQFPALFAARGFWMPLLALVVGGLLSGVLAGVFEDLGRDLAIKLGAPEEEGEEDIEEIASTVSTEVGRRMKEQLDKAPLPRDRGESDG